MYGKSRKSARSYRGSVSRNYRKPYSRMLKTAPYTGRRGTYKTGLRFATVGFTRNVEKKYHDKTYQANSKEAATGNSGGANQSNNGVGYVSDTWGSYSFNGVESPGASSNDILKGLETGTTARTRVGNKIRGCYIKGSFTFTAALGSVGQMDPNLGQGGESTFGPLAVNRQPYVRTTFRMVIVKDLQVNSTDVNVRWEDVFEQSGKIGGVHSELNVDNMGRFIVLEDRIFDLDSDTPQKTVPFTIGANKIGSVRYNGSGANALTDKGIYVIYAAFVMGTFSTDLNVIQLPSPVGHTRLCFSDD